MTDSRWIRLALCVILLTGCAGCWDYKEYESMALVRAIGIDMDKNGEFLLSYEIIRTQKQDKPDWKAKEVVQGTGKTVPEAFDNIQTVMPEELFLGYATTVIIGEAAAKQQLKTIMDLLFINTSMRESVFLAFTKENPEHILKMSIGKSGLLVGESLVDFFKVTTGVGVSFPVRLREFNKMLMAEGVEAVAPLLTIRGDNTLKITDIAVFNGFKMTGALDGEESKGLARITNTNIQEMISVDVKEPGTGAAVSAIFRLRGNRSKIKVNADGEVPEAYVKTRAEATMIQFGGDVGTISSEILRACEEELEATLKRELEATIAKAQREYKSDFLGIGQLLYQQHRKAWRSRYKAEWDEVFPAVPFHLDVHVNILNSGTKVVPLSEQ